jgi:DNA end-binding protein Ku
MSNPVWRGVLRHGRGKGEVEFGVKLHSGPRADNVSFCQLDGADATPVKQKWIRADGEQLRGALVKGIEAETGLFLPFTAEEIAAAHPAPPRVLVISGVVRAEYFEPHQFESCYYVAPDGEAEPEYAALLIALRDARMVAATRVMISTRERPAIIRPLGTGLALQTLYYAHEMRSLDAFRTNRVKTDAVILPKPSLPRDFFSGDAQREAIATMIERRLEEHRRIKKAQ